MITIQPVAGDPGLWQLLAEQRFAKPRDEVFQFFADANQLERITPPWLHFSIVSELPIEMRAGALIDYRLRMRGIPIFWRTEISAWEPSVRFVDQQLRGPYRLWHHEHLFLDEGQHTVVRDVVNYRVPLGVLLHRPLVRPELIRIFQYRHDVLAKIFA